MDADFAKFLETVDERFQNFVVEIDDYLRSRRCKRAIKTAKSGYVVSYTLPDTKRTLASFVPRKSGMKLRIYPEHVAAYESLLDAFPENMKRDIRKASPCKRLLNPNDCNPRCVMGYAFSLEGEPFKKCRYMAFMPTLSEENNPHIKRFLERELACCAE